MILSDVMDELANAMGTIPGLRVHAFPPDVVHPPAAVVTYPDTYTYDETYGRGMDRLEIPIVVLVGKVSDRKSRDELGAYVDGSGPRSIKQALESGPHVAMDTVRVMTAEFDIISMAGVEYAAATLNADITGKGA